MNGMSYTKKRFSLPSTEPTKVPCKIHHFVKGKCLRCPEKIVERNDEAFNVSEGEE